MLPPFGVMTEKEIDAVTQLIESAILDIKSQKGATPS